MKIYRDKKTVPSLFPNIQGLNAYRWFKVGSLVVPNISEGELLEAKGFYTMENNQSFIFEHVTMITVSETALNDDYVINPFTGYDTDTPTKYGLGLIGGWDKIPYNGQNITPSPGQHYDSPFVLQDYIADDDYNELHFTMWVKLTSSMANGTQQAKVHDRQTYFQVKHHIGITPEVLYEIDDMPVWEESYAVTPSLDVGDVNGYGLRSVIPSSAISKSGTKIRVILSAPLVSGHTMSLARMYIGEKHASIPYRFASAPTQIKFAGSDGVTHSYGGADIVSDEINFTIDETKDYLVYFGMASSTNYGARTAPGGTNSYYKVSANNDAGTLGVTGYTLDSACGEYIIKKIEVS